MPLELCKVPPGNLKKWESPAEGLNLVEVTGKFRTQSYLKMNPEAQAKGVGTSMEEPWKFF